MSDLIHTSEGASEQTIYEFRPAGFWIRVVATLVDFIVFIPVVALSFYAISSKSLFLTLLLILPGVLYKPLMEAFYGATLGKMACGLRVVDKSGANLSVPRA
ncbi:RDD family protein, partial [Candidatus Sumerlaeota bacterium]|nr:RDD family protein [Candidatus Sumerlaeota bacterium]